MALVREFLRDHRPRFIMLEQVKGADMRYRGQSETKWAAIRNVLKETGYSFHDVEVDSSQFVPQSRVRKYMVAVDKEGHVSHWLPVNATIAHSLETSMDTFVDLVTLTKSCRLPEDRAFRLHDFIYDFE